ncbi:ATP-binding protein [Bacteroides sp. AN502(2024)]|uniref:RNA-binding domain-containing protein n=1 Tax=Bacteroides sp. AN502(2024) TaxID=3160599 RepID=UPI0035163646
MTIEEITTRKEGQTFDCKSIQIEPKALAIPIVAMANADGGVLAIGVSDKTRRIEGVDGNEMRLNDLLRVPYDFCNPSVRVKCEYVPCTDSEGKENRILLMYIPASGQLHTNQADECFMRVGDKSKKLNFEERMQLLYDKGERYYEDKDVYGASINDVDMNLVNDYMDVIGYNKSAMEYLRENNDFVMEVDGLQKISTACILLFGKNPQRFFPRARTRFIRYEGTEEKVGTEMNVIKDATFEGVILQQVRSTIDYLETQVREHSYLGEDGLFRTDRDYPQFVIQEMVVNSVCHRAYNIKGTEIQIKMFDDRLVFETPGDLPGLVRPDNIRHTHFSRNPKIAQYLKAYKYVKEFGEGMDRIYRELNVNHTSEPKVHLDAFILKISVYKNTSKLIDNVPEVTDKMIENSGRIIENAKDATEKLTENREGLIDKLTEKFIANGDKLTENRKRMLMLMMDNPYVSKEELSKTIGISVAAVSSNISVMRGKYLNRIGPDKGGFWEVILE